MINHWTPANPGDKYAIAARDETGVRLPYTIAKVLVMGSIRFEAWHNATLLSAHDNPQSAREACAEHERGDV